MAAPGWWVPYITAKAKALGLDPKAVIAVARQEGLSGRVGDGGHAFGPFQLNDAGGVLTGRPGDHQAFAESRQGIDWALQHIAGVARGETGQRAVHDIVYGFERPADKPGEFQRALAAYGGKVPVGSGAIGAPSALDSSGASALGTPAYASALSGMLTQQIDRLLSGDTTLHPEETAAIAQFVKQRQTGLAAANTYGAPSSGTRLAAGKGVQWLGVPTAGEDSGLLGKVSQAAQSVGITKIRVTSGRRSASHNAAVGGVPGSNHLSGHALDGEGYIPGKGWVPLGQALLPVASKFGLRSGDVPGFFNGGTDPVHVDDGFNVRS